MTMRRPDDADAFHVLSVEGAPKTGKTHLALTAPGVVAVHSSDHGWDGVLQKQEDWAERYLVNDYYAQIDLSADEMFRDNDRDAAERAADKQADRINREAWLPFSADVQEMYKDPMVRSMVWDQADELYEFLRLANFGKLEKNPQLAYGPVNMEWKSLVRTARQVKKNLILIHQLKPKYRNVVDPQSGKEKSVLVEGQFVRRGNSSTDYLVDSFVRTAYEPAKRDLRGTVVKPQTWTLEIMLARRNPDANGLVLEAPDWITLMQFLAPDIPGEMWL